MKIKELFPPGAVPEGDYKTRDFLSQIDEVFSQVIGRIEAVFTSTPGEKEGTFYSDWQRITGLEDPESGLKRRCDYYNGLNLSNTKEHFFRVNPEDSLEFSSNKVTVILKRPIVETSQRSGMRIGRAIRAFKRPEEVVSAYEKMRHAHIMMEYKNA